MQDKFDLRIKDHVERLKRQSCRAIEAEVAQKRVAWFRQNHQAAGLPVRPSPRRAYELLFFDYLGLSENEVPVLSETEHEIVWLSLNAYPTLEAVKELRLDTRQICRAAYEKSTQALVSQLDPQLRFLRSYEEIRPYANHCKEMIIRVDFEAMMRIALQEAAASKQSGNPGYGAIVVLGPRILGKAHATAVAEQEPNRHAEVNAVRQAVQVLGDSNLSGAILFSTCEPYPKCVALAIRANLTTIVYGVSIEEIARPGESKRPVGAKEIVEQSPVMIEFIGNVLRDECQSLYG